MRLLDLLLGHEDIASADRIIPGRLYISDDGDAIAPDGYCPELTAVVVRVVFRRYNEKDQGKALRALRLLCSFEHVKGEPWSAFLHEDDEAGERRVTALLKKLKATTRKVPVDGTILVAHASLTYLRVLLVTVREFYRELCRDNLHAPDSPMDVRNWRKWEVRVRMAWAKERNYHPVFGLNHAGHRFFVQGAEQKSRMLYDPYAAAAALSEAVDRIGVPAAIVEIKDTQRANGLRYSDFAFGTAYGYALAGLEDHFRCRNKQNGDELVKTATISSDVQAAIRARFEAVPHPNGGGGTLWDRIGELRICLARGGTAHAEAKAELERYTLFGKTPLDEAPTYDTYRYWLRKAALRFNVVVQTNLGPWIPSSIVFRKAAIGAAVKALFERTTDTNERAEGLAEIKDRFGHSTDQSKAYADWEYELDAIRTQKNIADSREMAIAAERAVSSAPVRSTRLQGATRRWIEVLKQRPTEAA